ncbi:hypothetical protein L593_14720 [Salinarchaeum sp. Harcht-Bsk1]|uniref:DUF7522 family protein n=1 Tax=Salinarchaeum sp. Harcht-Bsk1 TaxID=1333523 RepID=UPI00034239D0|nr:hypothetical protein [Salinarchaeum sp. Harcht-Bsk1]AGN02878.1 hypothetical protein L593_14720 [Salinarchaeum sp. Harcht-Bsk1]
MTLQTALTEEMSESIVSAVRTSLGDTLRSVVYFTPSNFDVLYTRQGLYESTHTVREAKSQLVEFERTGFAEGPVRTMLAQREDGTDIGAYEFTVRFHEDGFVVRILRGDAGVLFTTDSMDVNAFEDAASALTGLLAEE